MKPLIDNLVAGFERGRLSRRQLVEGLSLIAAAAAAPNLAKAAAAPQPAGVKGLAIDHVSVQVSDMARSIDFYSKSFNFKVVGEDKDNNIVRLGVDHTLVSLHPAAARGERPGRVDHFCIKVPEYDQEKLAAQLKALGVDSTFDIWSGFYVKDPDGVHVQMI